MNDECTVITITHLLFSALLEVQELSLFPPQTVFLKNDASCFEFMQAVILLKLKNSSKLQTLNYNLLNNFSC